MGDTRYGPVRYALTGDRERARTFLPLARNALLRLQERQRMTKVLSWTDVVDLAPGVACTIRLAGPIASVFVHAFPETETAGLGTVVIPRPRVWVPRGFVVTPVSNASVLGWGFPFLLEGDDAFAAENLKPGLDLFRWTAGGKLPQVLLTRVLDAGYPRNDEAEADEPMSRLPMLFDVDHPPNPVDDEGNVNLLLPPYSSPLQAFRPEFVAYAPETYHEWDEETREWVAAWKQQQFNAVNEHRVSIGREKVLPPMRGYADTAQITADIIVETNVVGHYADEYPDNFKTLEDRLTKDGFLGELIASDADHRTGGGAGGASGENLLYSHSGPVENIGTDPEGFPIVRIEPGVRVPSDEALEGWLDSPPHRAIIESDIWDNGHTSLNLGASDYAYAQHFVSRDAWIHVGNKVWHSNLTGVPDVSYMGFLTENLGFETWPVSFNNAGASGSWPFPSANYINVLYNGLQAGDGRMYLRYSFRPHYEDIAGTSAVQLALESRIFCRGRSIAVAPRGALVWSAGFQKHDGFTRLVAIVHDDNDQLGNPRDNGHAPIIRVWYADIPDIDGFLANPSAVIRGVAGESDGWPWDDSDSAWRWRGGATVDVGTSDGTLRDYLKYSSVWQIRGDGLRACCLRDHGTSRDLSDYWATQWGGYPPGFGITHFTPLGYNRHLFELDLSNAALPTLTITTTPPNATRNEPADYIDDPYFSSMIWRVITEPLAAYWRGNEVECLHVFSARRANTSSSAAIVSHLYLGFGAFDEVDLHAMESTFRTSRLPARGPELSPEIAPRPMLLSGYDRAYVLLRTAAKAWASNDIPGVLSWTVIPEAFCWTSGGSAIHHVEVRIDGTNIHAGWVSTPDASSYSLDAYCAVAYDSEGPLQLNKGVIPVVSVSNWALPVFAKRGNEWVVSVGVCPQVFWGLRIANPSGAMCYDYLNAPTGCPDVMVDVQPVASIDNGTARTNVVTATNLGGIADIMGIPEAGFALFSARAL